MGFQTAVQTVSDGDIDSPYPDAAEADAYIYAGTEALHPWLHGDTRIHVLDAGRQVSSSQEASCQFSHNSEQESCPNAGNNFWDFLLHIQCPVNPGVS